MLLGVATTGEEMAKLMEIATTRGRAMGETVGQAFNDIVTGLGRGSALILDNLGIVVNATEVNEKYAASLGKSAEALTETEKKQALINAVLADTTSAAGATIDPTERLSAATDNFKESVGRFINEATGWPDLLNSIADSTNNVTDAINEGLARDAAKNASLLGSEILRLSDEAANAETTLAALKDAGLENSEAYRTLTASLEATRTQLGGMSADADVVNAVVASLADQSGQAEVAFQGLGLGAQQAGAGVAAAGNDFVIATGKIEDFIRALDNQAIAKSQAAWNGVANSIDSAAASSGRLFAENQGGDAGLARQKNLTAELTAQWGLYQAQGYETDQIANVLMPAYIAQISDADRALFKVETATRGISDATREAEQAFNDLKGKVASVLQGALDPGVGVNPADFLPREDTVNENARRLADLMVNGLKGQDWLEQFRSEAPDIYKAIAESGDPQAAAATILRDFQDGLRPDLLDKDAAKEQVKRMIVGEQNLAELGQEIAAEIAAEMGIGLAQAQSATASALGLGNTSTAGTDAAGVFADGMTTGAQERGGDVVAAFATSMKANFATLLSEGVAAGRTWGDGFITGAQDVPAELIALLTSLITPGVESNIRLRGTLEGTATP